MNKKYFLCLSILITSLLIILCGSADADEGMWTFDNLPKKQLKEKYNFTITPEWLENVRLSSVRLSDGGSGAFISSTGLVLTNHHVAIEQLQKMSSKEKDYVKTGYYAKSRDKEIKCVDLELNVLTSMKNITGIINKATKGLSPEKALKARKKVISGIEKENMKDPDTVAEVVVFYDGGEYWLYIYRKYRDVRLVMAPEEQIANFGGDYDNFTYPRYSLDFAIFRAYEKNKPAVTKNYLKMSAKGLKKGELIFVSGFPGYTSRFSTYATIKFLKHYYKIDLDDTIHILNLLEDYSAGGKEQKRRATALFHSLNNSKKLVQGEYNGLLDPAIINKIRGVENQLIRDVNNQPRLKNEVGDAWEVVAIKYDEFTKNYKKFRYRQLGFTENSRLPEIANSIVLYVKEVKKPDSDRLDGYHDSQLGAWKYNILSPAPIYRDLEEAILAKELQLAKENLGNEDKYIKILMAGKTPQERAKELIQQTKLVDAGYRKSLIKGGEKAVFNSDDPLIKLALELEPLRRKMINWRNQKIRAPLQSANEKIAKARFKIYGKNIYPDANSSLRLSYGTSVGYPYNGTLAPYQTTFYGLFDRFYSFNDRKSPWNLPGKFLRTDLPGLFR